MLVLLQILVYLVFTFAKFFYLEAQIVVLLLQEVFALDDDRPLLIFNFDLTPNPLIQDFHLALGVFDLSVDFLDESIQRQDIIFFFFIWLFERRLTLLSQLVLLFSQVDLFLLILINLDRLVKVFITLQITDNLSEFSLNWIASNILLLEQCFQFVVEQKVAVYFVFFKYVYHFVIVFDV